MTKSTPIDAAALRAKLPELIFIPDMAIVLGVTESAARRIVLRGDCGRYGRIGRRIVVRRTTFLAAITRRAR